MGSVDEFEKTRFGGHQAAWHVQPGSTIGESYDGYPHACDNCLDVSRMDSVQHGSPICPTDDASLGRLERCQRARCVVDVGGHDSCHDAAVCAADDPDFCRYQSAREEARARGRAFVSAYLAVWVGFSSAVVVAQCGRFRPWVG